MLQNLENSDIQDISPQELFWRMFVCVCVCVYTDVYCVYRNFWNNTLNIVNHDYL